MEAKTSTFQISALQSGTMASQECEGDSSTQVGHRDTLLLKGNESQTHCTEDFSQRIFVGKHSAYYQRITKQHSSTGLQNAKYLAEHAGPSCKMAQDIIREHRIKSLVLKGETLRSVAPFEMNPFTETSLGSKLVCVLNSRFINVQAHNPATHCLRYV
jgi:hypothetical protein